MKENGKEMRSFWEREENVVLCYLKLLSRRFYIVRGGMENIFCIALLFCNKRRGIVCATKVNQSFHIIVEFNDAK